jgi:hypothetical protein
LPLSQQLIRCCRSEGRAATVGIDHETEDVEASISIRALALKMNQQMKEITAIVKLTILVKSREIEATCRAQAAGVRLARTSSWKSACHVVSHVIFSKTFFALLPVIHADV